MKRQHTFRNISICLNLSHTNTAANENGCSDPREYMTLRLSNAFKWNGEHGSRAEGSAGRKKSGSLNFGLLIWAAVFVDYTVVVASQVQGVGNVERIPSFSSCIWFGLHTGSCSGHNVIGHSSLLSVCFLVGFPISLGVFSFVAFGRRVDVSWSARSRHR